MKEYKADTFCHESPLLSELSSKRDVQALANWRTVPPRGRAYSTNEKSGFHRWEEEIPQMGRADSANKKSGFH